MAQFPGSTPIEELKSKIGFGTFDSWIGEIGADSGKNHVTLDKSPLSEALLLKGSKILLVKGPNYSLLAIFNIDGYYSGRIWDNRNMNTWPIQGSYNSFESMAEELSKLVPKE